MAFLSETSGQLCPLVTKQQIHRLLWLLQIGSGEEGLVLVIQSGVLLLLSDCPIAVPLPAGHELSKWRPCFRRYGSASCNVSSWHQLPQGDSWVVAEIYQAGFSADHKRWGGQSIQLSLSGEFPITLPSRSQIEKWCSLDLECSPEAPVLKGWTAACGGGPLRGGA